MDRKRAVTLWLPEALLAEVAARGDNRSAVVTRDLGRLYTLYESALRGLGAGEETALEWAREAGGRAGAALTEILRAGHPAWSALEVHAVADLVERMRRGEGA